MYIIFWQWIIFRILRFKIVKIHWWYDRFSGGQNDLQIWCKVFIYLASSSRSRTWSAAPDDGPGDGRDGVHGLRRPRRPRWCCRCGRCRTTRRPRLRQLLTGGVPWPCCKTGPRPWTQWARTGTRRASFDRTRSGRRIPWPRDPCWTWPRCRSDRRNWLGSGTSSPCWPPLLRRSDYVISCRYLIGPRAGCVEIWIPPGLLLYITIAPTSLYYYIIITQLTEISQWRRRRRPR